MKLKCRINETEYDIVQGASFSEERNETLDSGTIIITHVEEMKNLKPYDDVYIWDAEYIFEGYYENKIVLSGEEYTYNIETEKFEKGGKSVFYKHLLVDNFSETMINLKDLLISKKEYEESGEKGVLGYTPIYEYKIQLMSETKGLEVVQLPNISVTQPLKAPYKVTAWEYMKRYIEIYSPLYKKVDDISIYTWKYEKKYSLSETLMYIFDNCYPQDFSLNNPNLKNVISTLMLTKDMIPYVVNGVIYAMDITSRRGYFNITNKINYISGSRTSNDHCDNLKTTYSDGLTQDTTARSIEYIGFRNNDSALMTLENMRLETRFPIYKINKMYMCYYAEVKVSLAEKKSSTWEVKDTVRYFLCKQDITPLVKLETERNALSQNWKELRDNPPYTVEDLSKYKIATIGYSSGSKVISGWGEKFVYPIKNSFWDVTKTYIQNIAEFLDKYYPYGIYTYQYVEKKIKEKENLDGIVYVDDSPLLDRIVSPFGIDPTGENAAIEFLKDFDFQENIKFKSFIFEIDYQAYYNGTVIHSKDNALDNITIVDNPSSSLSLLEYDGLSKKEKANRFGNKSLQINARYDDMRELQELNTVFENYNNTDVIIYHREYQIWDNYIQTVYYGIHDYVLKNFYTSVFARHRTWNLMPYNESVRRAENKKMYINLSKEECYYEKETDVNDRKFSFKQFDNNFSFLILLLSAFKNSEVKSINYFGNDNKINYGYLVHKNKCYSTDFNAFTSGYSLCFNICMNDNISAGNYIDEVDSLVNNDYGEVITYKGSDATKKALKLLFMKDVGDDYTGSKQDWYRLIDDVETGYAKQIGFYVSKVDNNIYDEVFKEPKEIMDKYNYGLLKLPFVATTIKGDENEIKDKNVVGGIYNIYKDNKEVIDMTYQIEPITTDQNILFSSWLMKLNDLTTNYIKTEVQNDLSEFIEKSIEFSFYFSTTSSGSVQDKAVTHGPFIFLKTNIRDFSVLLANKKSGYFSKTYKIPNDQKIEYTYVDFANSLYSPYVSALTFNGAFTIDEVTDRTIKITFYRTIIVNQDDIYYAQPDTFIFEKDYNVPAEGEEVWFRCHKTSTYIEEINKTYKAEICMDGNNKKILSEHWLDSDGFLYTSFRDVLKDYFQSTAEISLENEINAIPVNKRYTKNMYLITSSKSLKKDLVYDEYFIAYDFDDKYSIYKKGDVAKITDTDGTKKVYMSIVDNVNSSNFVPENWKILENAHILEGTNLYKITTDEDFWIKQGIINTEENVSDIISLENTNGRAIIKLDLENLSNLSEIESVQYWYEDNGSLKLVFASNLTELEKEKKQVKIYASLISNRDKRVYNDNHFVQGEILNLANVDKYINPNYQLYDVPPFILGYNLIVDSNNKDYFNTTIERLSSEYGGECKILDLSIDKIYYKDKLKITFSSTNDSAYDIKSVKINGIAAQKENIIEVIDDINIYVETYANTLNIIIDADEGGIIKLERTSSSYAKAFLGEITTNDVIYYGDVIKAKLELKDKFVLDTFTVNGISKPSEISITMTKDTTIVSRTQKSGNKVIWEGNWEYNFLENDGLSEETIFDLRQVLDTEIVLKQRPVIITFGYIEVAYATDLTNLNNIAGGGNKENLSFYNGETMYAGDFLEGSLNEEAILIFDRDITGTDATIEETRFLKFTRTLGKYGSYQCMFSKFIITKIEQQY